MHNQSRHVGHAVTAQFKRNDTDITAMSSALAWPERVVSIPPSQAFSLAEKQSRDSPAKPKAILCSSVPLPAVMVPIVP